MSVTIQFCTALRNFDLEKLEVEPSLNLSTSEDLRLRLHWVAMLYGHLRAQLAITDQNQVELSASGGKQSRRLDEQQLPFLLA